jgi:integrase
VPLREGIAQLIRERAPWRLSEWRWQSLAAALRGDLEQLGMAAEDYAGRRRTFYSLRGYFAGRVLEVAPINVASKLMRHANPQTTLQWYARTSDERMRESVEALG